MKNKILFSSVGIIVIILAISLLCQFNTEEKVVLTDKHVPRKIETSAISMMYETEAGSGIYEESNDSLWPSEGYTFNATLSKCENGSTLSYDEENGRVMMQTNKSDRCYVYFDALPLVVYWNDDLSGTTYTFPNTPATTYTNPTQLSSQYYIKTTDTEHQACLYYNGKEFCFGANYWDTDRSTTQTKLQNEMASALGVDASSLSCSLPSKGAICDVSVFSCSADSSGFVGCGDGYGYCKVYSDGDASCVE